MKPLSPEEEKVSRTVKIKRAPGYGPRAANQGRGPLGAFVFLALVFTFRAASAGALDFGLAIEQEAKASNERGGGAFFYTPVLRPWVQGPLGRNFSLYLSGKAGFEYADDAWRDPAVLPELDRSELIWRVSPSLYLTLGRQRYQDASGFAASGLFDGISAGFSAGGSRFSAGAYYTGLLYKDTADIIMTGGDKREYQKPLSFTGGYFASRRILAAFEWENPSLGPRSVLALGLLGQFDLNGEADWFHSQYLSARYGLRLAGGLGFEGTGSLGTGEGPGGTVTFCFTGSLGLNWDLPGALDDTLSLRGLYSSPSAGSHLAPFIPVNSTAQGEVFSPAVGGISVIRGAYSLRPRQTLSFAGECRYFIRTDTVSFTDNREPGTLKGDGYFLGGELYGRALWTPLPDITVSAGGGAFFPQLGNAFAAGTKIRWQASLGLILAL
jgi:hypothetical protein